jgi:hypothetical protein
MQFAERQVAPAASATSRPEIGELGATGTPIFGGFLREMGEYNSDLSGLAAYSTYEKMRRGDAQVAATLMAMKLPIRTASWTVVVPEDASDVEKAATEFVEHCLFERINFDTALQNALLMLDFGAAAHEDVWEMEGQQVVLRKLAPRLPLTFYRWITESNGDELQAIEQLGYRGGQYVRAEVPVTKLGLFTYRQEGANFAGRSALREMYQPWYIKSNLYKIDAISCERNGMGVPTIIMGENAKKEDRDTAITWLEQLSVHQKAGLLLPFGWLFKLEGVTGVTRDAKDSIAHHNLMISMAGLAQFMMLGQASAGGSRALGKTMSDFFYMGLQATADYVGSTMSLSTVKRLVDFNFAGVVNYPKLIPQQILSVSFEGLVEALRYLAMDRVDVLRPDDDTEAWMRQQMGAPKMGVPRLPRPTAVTETVTGPSSGDDGEENAPPEPALKGTDSLTVAVRKLVGGAAVRREPVGYEKFLALDEIVSALDKGRDEVAAALRAARSRVQAEIVHKLMNVPVRNMHRVSVAPDEKLTAAIEAILNGVYSFGVAQVAGEKGRQRPGSAATVRMADKRDPLGVYADGVVSEFTNGLTARAANVALDYRRRPGALTPGEIIRQTEDDLDSQSDKWIDGAASKGANEAFADGRADGYGEHADEIKEVIYSALLDINTCEECAGADGESGETPDDIPDVPNPDCEGGDKCRCVHVYVFADEGK